MYVAQVLGNVNVNVRIRIRSYIALSEASISTHIIRRDGRGVRAASGRRQNMHTVYKRTSDVLRVSVCAPFLFELGSASLSPL
jgi:hypothetical protein